MAERLANIFGTEKDKVNCPFYFKIGACRHGDRCSRVHNKPSVSQTLIFHNMYVNPTTVAVTVDGGSLEVDDVEAQQHYDEFYEDVFSELGNFGEIEEMHVIANLGDHLSGNLYVKYTREEDAVTALSKLQGRFYAGRPILGEFSPVTDFREARCRQYDVGECTRGGFCNFIHMCKPSKNLVRDLFKRQRQKFHKNSRSRSRSRSRSPRRHDRRERSPRRDRDNNRDRRDHRDKDPRDRERGGGRGGEPRERERDRDNRDNKDNRDNRERDKDRRDYRDRDYDRDNRDQGKPEVDRNKDDGREKVKNGNSDNNGVSTTQNHD